MKEMINVDGIEMTRDEIIKNIREMNFIDKDLALGYEIYEDDCTGCLFEIDLDGKEVTHIFEIDKDFEIVDILF